MKRECFKWLNGTKLEDLEVGLLLFIGPLSDIIQLLLTALFSMQEEEDDEILETDSQTSGV
jgi:hypothetical protein